MTNFSKIGVTKTKHIYGSPNDKNNYEVYNHIFYGTKQMNAKF